MKILFTVALLACFIHSGAQINNHLSQVKQKLKYDEASVYLITLGTLSKMALIAGNFNYIDSSSTHIGIGICNMGEIWIYHVTDLNSGSGSALMKETLEQFIDREDVYYFSIWVSKPSSTIKRKIISQCINYSKRKIYFDAGFEIRSDDTLYCSEFCAKILIASGGELFKYQPRICEINNSLFENILGRKYLEYFPVDFFRINNTFKKLAGYRLNSGKWEKEKPRKIRAFHLLQTTKPYH